MTQPTNPYGTLGTVNYGGSPSPEVQGDALNIIGSFAGQSPGAAGAQIGASSNANNLASAYSGQGQTNQGTDAALGGAAAAGYGSQGNNLDSDLSATGASQYWAANTLGQDASSNLLGLQKADQNLSAPTVNTAGVYDPLNAANAAYSNAAAGNGPSGASYLLSSGVDAAIQGQAAAAAGARGNSNLAGASYNAAQNSGQIEAQAANQAAQLKAQEEQSALAGQAGTATNLTGTAANIANTNAGLAAGTQNLGVTSALNAGAAAGNAGLAGFTAGAGAENNLTGIGTSADLGFNGLGANTGLGYSTLGQNQGLAYNTLGETTEGQQLTADVANQTNQTQNNISNAKNGQSAVGSLLQGVGDAFGGLLGGGGSVGASGDPAGDGVLGI